MYQLAKIIKDVCENHSDKVAVRSYSDGCVKPIFYHQFNEAADLVTAILSEVLSRNFEIVTHNYVAVLVDVSDIYPVVIQGILLSGRPFVCLDVDGSSSDLINLIVKLKIEILLTNEKHADNIRTNFVKSEKLQEFKLFEYACEIWRTGISHSASNNVENVSERLLYAIQTSGSTGEKKIVQVTEDCILPNILELRDLFRLTCTDVIYYGSPVTFDPNIIELFLALTSGASLFIVCSSRARAALIPVLVDVLFPRDEQQNSENNSSSSWCVTVIQTTPSIFLSWPTQLTRNTIMHRLKVLALGGEECPSRDELSDYCSPADFSKIFNLYGITEVSCWASYSNLSAGYDCHTLGVTMRETLLQVRDTAGNVVNDGIGEIFIGSSRRICIVDEDSISKVLTDSEKEPLFRATGDLVQVENNGKSFRFVGRKDRMVKRFGQKVNLAIIEETTRKNASVSNCCCVNDDRHGLVLFYQSDNFKTGNDDALKCWLKTDGLLPNNASIPDTIVQLHELPLNANGKIDRSHLKRLLNETDRAVANEIPFRQQLRSLWTSCTSGSSLNFDKQNETSNELSNSAGFVSSGGTSISALHFISKLHSKFRLNVPRELLANLLSDCTFAECCNLFDRTAPWESSSETAACNPKRKTVLDVCETKIMKRQKVDRTILDSSNAESTVISVKCRGRLVMYDGSLIYNEKSELNLSEKISLNVEWKYLLKKCVDASPTVIAFKNGTTTVAVGSHSGDLVNLEFESGVLKFACHLPDRIESSLAVSPCGKYGYIGCYDGHLRCIDMETGKTVGSFATNGMIKSSPVAHNQGTIIFGSYDQHLYCISDKFQLVWKWKGGGSCYATPCIDHNNNNLVFAGLLDGCCVCLQTENGDLVWKTKLSSPIFSSPLLLDSDAVLFVEVSGTVNCLNTVCGSLLWSYKADGNIFSSLASACFNNCTLLLFGCHDNNVYCLSARDVKNPPSLIWKTCLSAPVFATPFVQLENGLAVVANTLGTIFILKLTDGLLLAALKLSGEIFSSPVIHDNRIVVGCRDNYLYCIILYFGPVS